MAADLVLLKSFVDGQGVGFDNYFVYASDHDGNYTLIEDFGNQLNAEIKAFAGNNAILILDILEAPVLGRLTGFIDDTSFAPVSFISGDTQIVIPTGVALTGAEGRSELLATATLTGSGGATTFFVALQVNGTATLETLAAQGIMDLYSVDWTGAVFTPATLLRLETIIPGGEDLRDQQTVLGGGTIPVQILDRLADRSENVENVLNGKTANAVAGGPVLGTIGVPGSLEGGRLAFATVATVTIGTTALTSYARDTTNALTIEWTGTLTANITVAGAGGLDTGAEASDTWYAVHVIGDTTRVNAPVALLSLSATAPTLPAGYDVFRRLGWVRNNSSSDFLIAQQVGNSKDRWHYFLENAGAELTVLLNGSATVPTTISLASLVPPSSRHVQLRLDLSNTVVDDGTDVRIQPTGAGLTGGNVVPILFQPGTDVTNEARVVQYTTTDASQQVDYEVESATDDIDIAVVAYMDEL